jgi:TonB family protein
MLAAQSSGLCPSTTAEPYLVCQVDRAPAAAPGNVAPGYPDMLLQARVTGTTRVRFVVDSVGHVPYGSFTVVESSHALFTASARNAVPKWTFTPATLRGRPVATRYEQLFTFSLPPDSDAPSCRRPYWRLAGSHPAQIPVCGHSRSVRLADRLHATARSLQLTRPGSRAPVEEEIMTADQRPDWRHHGVRIVRADQLDMNTPQTQGMTRAAAITHARTGAQKLWAGTVTINPNAKTGAHHHGALESVIYVVRGRARMRWGDALEFVAEAGPGDFIYVPPYVPHQEINAAPDEPLECVLVRSDQEAVVVNLDIRPAEVVEEVVWVDPNHPEPR